MNLSVLYNYSVTQSHTHWVTDVTVFSEIKLYEVQKKVSRNLLERFTLNVVFIYQNVCILDFISIFMSVRLSV